MKYGIVGEDDSDVLTLRELIIRFHERARLPTASFKKHGFRGCANLLSKGARYLEMFEADGCERLIVLYDADRDDPAARRQRAELEIVKVANISIPCFVCVPVQEIEAWFLADTAAVTKVIPKCGILKEYTSPELQRDPKEQLKRICLDPKTRKSLYSPPTHNEKVARCVDLDLLLSKCSSARELANFVEGK